MAAPSGWSSLKKNKYSSVFHDLNNRSIFGTDSSHTQLPNSSKGMYFVYAKEKPNQCYQLTPIDKGNLTHM